ncbi:MAG: hypothetical protein HQL64_07680 [Magnetococcales bacterium]|nr:hypothetical protein [Magnetococcales bacterium]
MRETFHPLLHRFLPGIFLCSSILIFSTPAYSGIAITEFYICKSETTSTKGVSYWYPNIGFRIKNNGKKDIDTSGNMHLVSMTDHTNRVELTKTNYGTAGGSLAAGYSSVRAVYSLTDGLIPRPTGEQSRNALDLNAIQLEINIDIRSSNTSMETKKVMLMPGDFDKLDVCL